MCVYCIILTSSSAEGPINDVQAMQSCQFGSIPGTWAISPPPPHNLTYKWDVQHFPPHPQLPYSPDFLTAPFGSRYQTLDPKCQLKNLIGNYLSLEATASQPPTPPSESVKILAISDSTDTHMLNYYLETLARRLGSNKSDSYQRIFKSSKVQLHDRTPRIPILNHAVTTTGLSLYQMYMMGIDGRQSPEQLPPTRIGAARKQFDAQFDSKQEPDLIILHANHWTLKILNEAWLGPQDLLIAAQPTLPLSYIHSFMENLTLAAREVRKHFPTSLIVYHTSAMVRHETESGRTTDGHRGWINRMFVSQLNQAGRYVANKLNMPLVDWEMMTRGLSPTQYLFDDVHPCDWFLFEAYNIFLNILQEHRTRQKSANLKALSLLKYAL